MDVTELPMVTEVREVQYQNAESPMDVTDSPIVTEVREVQPENALFPMVNTLFPTTIDLIDDLYDFQGVLDEEA